MPLDHLLDSNMCRFANSTGIMKNLGLFLYLCREDADWILLRWIAKGCPRREESFEMIQGDWMVGSNLLLPDFCLSCLRYFGITLSGRCRLGCPDCKEHWKGKRVLDTAKLLLGYEDVVVSYLFSYHYHRIFGE